MNLFEDWKVNFINWTWELPQTLLGWVIMKKVKVYKIENFKGVKLVLMEDKKFGISLGRYVIINKRHSQNTKNHEYGHCIQSKIFGPLYLLIIGLPSITLNILSDIIGGEFKSNYYNRFPENWADKLGKVERTFIYKIKY